MATFSYDLEFHNIQCYVFFFFGSELLQMNNIGKEPLSKYRLSSITCSQKHIEAQSVKFHNRELYVIGELLCPESKN